MSGMTHLEDLEEHYPLGGGLCLKHGSGDGQHLVPILQLPTGADNIKYLFLELSSVGKKIITERHLQSGVVFDNYNEMVCS